MFFMSCSVSCDAKPCMIGFGRLPLLNSCSCLTMYSGCCCDRRGLAGVPELPPGPWQAAQTALNLVPPAAMSGLPLVGTGAMAAGAVGAWVAAAAPGVPATGAGGATVRPDAPGAAALAAGAAAAAAGAAGCWAEVESANAASTAANSREAGVLITVIGLDWRKTTGFYNAAPSPLPAP